MAIFAHILPRRSETPSLGPGRRHIPLPAFAWQEGYGAFTVSASNREDVAAYIARQEQHHRKRTFREEYVEFLRKSGVEFDERFFD